MILFLNYGWEKEEEEEGSEGIGRHGWAEDGGLGDFNGRRIGDQLEVEHFCIWLTICVHPDL